MSGNVRKAWVIVLASVLGACASAGPGEHIVMFAEDGRPVDPTRPGWISDYHKMDAFDDSGEWSAYLDALFAELDAHFEALPREDGPGRVMLFIHGGLNDVPDTVERAREFSPAIRADGTSYPVFLNWRSNLLNSYTAHLGRVRQGGTLFGAGNGPVDTVWDSVQFVFFPLVLAADVARGVIRFPFVAVNQLREAGEWLGVGDSPARRKADQAASLFVERAKEDRQAVQVEAHTTTGELSFMQGLENVGGFVRWLVFLPVKVVTTTVVDIGGTGSWSMMSRRVNLLFERPDGVVHEHQPERGLRVFLRRLADAQLEHGFEVDLVGHSMGTIVANRILRETVTGAEVHTDEHGVPRLVAPTFTHVTYLAAACSLADYETSVFSYLQAHPRTRMHHVTLHPDNEIGEAPLWDLAPRGSLLTWIDDFLALPLTPRDRTAGRSTNLLPALEATPAALRPQIEVRVLPWDVDGLPQTHGGFDDVSELWQFWNRAHWRPDPAASDTPPRDPERAQRA